MLGILDWGIGGLGFYARLKEVCPDAGMVYLSDSGATPYGRMTRDELRRRVAAAIGFLAAQGAERVVVACNAASTVVPQVRSRFGFEVVSIIENGIGLAKESGARNLGVVGGGRTIRSGIYQRALGREGIAVRGRTAQPLSALIEAGEWQGETFARALEHILHPLKKCDAILLACTHYPAAVDRFRAVLPDAEMFDPVDHLLPSLLPSLSSPASHGTDRFMTTGDPEQMKRSGALAFGVGLQEIEKIEADFTPASLYAGS